MERTAITGTTLYIGEKDLEGYILNLIRGYQFRRDNQYPERVVVPVIEQIEGVELSYVGMKEETDHDKSKGKV